MRSRKLAIVGMVVALGAAMFVGVAHASFVSVSEGNLLTGKTVLASSSYDSTGFPKAGVVDGAAGDAPNKSDFLFANDGGVEQLVISGFNSNVAKIRIWTEPDFTPGSVTVRSSTNNVTSADWGALSTDPTTVFEKSLVSATTLSVFPEPSGNANSWTVGATAGSWTVSSQVPSGPSNTIASLYKEFLVSAPAGTQSLYFNFGATGGGDAGWNIGRISEIQAFSAVPEPSTVALLVSGAIGLLAYAWRKRK
jgi:hypothetical protein